MWHSSCDIANPVLLVKEIIILLFTEHYKSADEELVMNIIKIRVEVIANRRDITGDRVQLSDILVVNLLILCCWQKKFNDKCSYVWNII